MNRWRLLFASITLGTLCACAAPQGTSTTPKIAAPPVEKKSAVQITNLPCAEIDQSVALTIRYATESIYRNGAVLPKEEGLACLEVLADSLKSVPQTNWQITVSGEEGHGFEPQALADKRQELLKRFFARKGLELKEWQWQAQAGGGVQLQLVELTGSP